MQPGTRFSRRSLLRLAGGSAVAFSVLGLAACQSNAAPTATVAPAAPGAAATPTTATAASPTTAAASPTTAAASPTAAGATAGTPTAGASPAASTPSAAMATPVGTTSTAYKTNTAASGNIRWQNRNNDQAQKMFKEFFADDFAKKYPNIKVSIEPAPDNRDEKLITAMVGGNAPDVFESWSDNVTQFADRGQVLDVTANVQRDYTADELKDFFPWQWRDFVIPTAQGTKIRFGLPKYVNVMFTWYNKDAFDKAGVKYPDETWDHNNYAEAAIKLAKSMGQSNFGLLYPVWSWDRFWYKIEEWGGTVVDPNDNTKATFDSDKALAAFEWSRKLMWDDKAMAQQLLLLGTGTSYDSTALFAAGRYAMNEEGFYPFNMATNIQKRFKWAYSPVPKGPVERKVLGTTDGFVQWKNSKQPDAAWEVMKYLAGKDFQVTQVKASGLLPIRFSALADWKQICLDAYPELADVNLDVGPQAMEQGYPGNRQFFKRDADARQIMEPALQKVFVTGNTPVTYFKDIAAQVTAKMRSS